MADEYTAKFKVDISDLKKNIADANKEIKLANATFKAETAGMEKWSQNADGLSAKLDQLESTLKGQKNILQSYEQQLSKQREAYKENGKRAEVLKDKLQQLADEGVSKADGEYKKYEQSLKDVQREQANNEKACDDLELAILNQKAAIGDTEKQIDRYSDAQKSMEKDAGSLTEKVKDQEKKLGDLKAEYIDVVAAEGKNSESAKKLAGEIEDLSNELKENKGKLADAEKAADDLDSSLGDVEKSSDKASKGFTVMRGALADLVAEGIKKAVEGLKDLAKSGYEAWQSYDEGADTIIAVTGATGDAAEDLLDVYDRVSSNVVGDFNDIGTAVGEVNTRFGLTGDELEETTEKFLKFAQINGTDVKTAIDTTQSAMAAWGISSQDAGKMLDLLNKAGQDTGVSVDKLASSLVANAPALQEMGYSASDAALFVANLEKSGADTSAVMTGMQKALANATKEGEPLSAAMSDVEEKIRGAKDSTEAITIASELFGAKAGPAIATAVRDNRLSFEEFGTSLEDFDGNIETTFDNMVDGPDRAALAIQNLKLEGAKMFDAFLEEHGPAIESLLTTFKDDILPGIVTVVSTILDGVNWFIDNLPFVIDLLAAAAIGLGAYLAYTTAVTIMTEGWAALTIVQKGAAAAQALLNAVMEANPIGIVIGLITALVAAFVILWNKSEDFRQFWIGLWDKIKNTVSSIGDWFETTWASIIAWFTGLWNSVSLFMSGLWSGIRDGASTAWNKIKEIWGVVKTWFDNNIVLPVKNAFSGAWEALRLGASDAWTGIKNIFIAVPDWFKDKFHEAWTKVKNVFETGGKIFDGIKEGISDVFKKVVNAIIGGINKVVAVPFGAINGVLDKLRGISIVGVEPFKWLGSISVPQIPELAQGGVLKRGQIGLLEGDGAEAVVPLDRNKKWIAAIAREMRNALNTEDGGSHTRPGASLAAASGSTYNYTQIINAPKSPSRAELYRQTRNLLDYRKRRN